MTNPTNKQRVQEYAGKIIKCPNCGATLKSFVVNCPTCGFELRNTKTISAVQEFSHKLEEIEASRKYERLGGLITFMISQQRISKTDEQKINLIHNFPVPNTKEDILEFLILATSNVNMRSYDSISNAASESQKALNDAWISKIKQVYEKALISYRNEDDFKQIQELYNKCHDDIQKSKKKRIIKWMLLFAPIGFLLLVLVLIILISSIQSPKAQEIEVERLEAIEQEVETALENGEYKKALLNAEGLEYSPSVRGNDYDELERQWNIKRELLIDEIIEEAEQNGVHLTYTSPNGESDSDVRADDNNGVEEGE
jgi:hypothetical protein